MGSNSCMNVACRGTTSSEWKKGWSLKSGELARLCLSCGSAYENSVFCETFHSDESGWRDCRICGKMIHCGCIASRYLHEYMDFGGVGCISCTKSLPVQKVQSEQIPGQICVFPSNGVEDSLAVGSWTDKEKYREKILQLTRAIGSFNMNSGKDGVQKEGPVSAVNINESSKLPNIAQQSSSAGFPEADISQKEEAGEMYDSLKEQPSQSLLLATPSRCSSTISDLFGWIVEGRNLIKGSFQVEHKATVTPSKPLKASHKAGGETNKGISSQTRVARSPAESQGRNQLLSRYLPRITDQELQQLSGHLKSKIVPLFEKILSASDAGRIGRLVLPKACAELYFPPISQSDGIAIKVQDTNGNEWTFQFRFWPNNNSRMYVLEGVTPCMQNMQVQAGDTVTFSRIEPGGQLVIGCRKATNLSEVKDSLMPSLPDSVNPGEASFSGIAGNPPSNGHGAIADSLQHHLATSKKKKARNVKNKRLLMHSDDALELSITWEEAQGLLRPSPDSKPTVVMVENHEFEEHKDPPIFGKKTIFCIGPLGEHEQLAQCDSCLQWRRLPVHAAISAKWTCSENIWDSKRSSCSDPEEINPENFGASSGKRLAPSCFNGGNAKSKKRKVSKKTDTNQVEASGLDALATAAVLGDMTESSTGATTRHPRHRPGCSCIVCIQPPSGKGKHEPTCKCNVCLTVKRRFKTMMMRKKKLQHGRGAEVITEQSQAPPPPAQIVSELQVDQKNHAEEMGKCELDLNSDPRREDCVLDEGGAAVTSDLVLQ